MRRRLFEIDLKDFGAGLINGPSRSAGRRDQAQVQFHALKRQAPSSSVMSAWYEPAIQVFCRSQLPLILVRASSHKYYDFPKVSRNLRARSRMRNGLVISSGCSTSLGALTIDCEA